MRPASVGFHCPDCAKSGAQKVLTRNQLFGGASAGAYPVTIALLAINVVVYVAGAVFKSRGSFDPIVEGGLLEAATVLNRSGVPVPRGVVEGEWWRILTSGFLHDGPLHLAFNGFALWNLGRSIEASVGAVRYVLVYFASLLMGSFGVLLVTEPNSLTVGASGAVFGLIGVLVAAQLAKGQSVMQSQLGSMLLLNVFITFTIPNISIGGHIGGLIGGLLSGFILFGLPKTFKGLRPTSEAAPLLALLAAVAVVGCVLVV